MVRAWYMNNDPVNLTEEHYMLPPKYVTLEDLHTMFGIEYYQLNVDSFETELDRIKNSKEFQFENEIFISGNENPNNFYIEEFYKNDEIRYIVEGSGYYDVKECNNKWVRIELVAGDLIILPAGCIHRFVLDKKNSIKMKRIFH